MEFSQIWDENTKLVKLKPEAAHHSNTSKHLIITGRRSPKDGQNLKILTTALKAEKYCFDRQFSSFGMSHCVNGLFVMV